MKRRSVIFILIFQLSILQADFDSGKLSARGSSYHPENSAQPKSSSTHVQSQMTHQVSAHTNLRAERTPSLSRSSPSFPQRTTGAAHPTAKQMPQNLSLHINQNRPRQANTQQNVRQSTKEIQTNRANANKALTYSRDTLRLNYPQANSWFSEKFFREHNHTPFFGHHQGNWYRCANWNNVAYWTSYGWSYPVSYDEDGGQEEYSNDEYDNYNADNNNNESADTSGEWLPLGVFAVAKTIEQTAYSPLFVQLAVAKDGTIGGSYYNAAQDNVYTLQGSIDKDTQLVSWKNVDNPNSPTMTCGLYNLTQNSASVQVDFPTGIHQTWKMVRMDQ